MVVARKIAYNVVASSLAKFLSTALALVSIGLITRYLGREGFGYYATVLAFLSFFSAIADLGLASTVTREISRPNANEPKILGNIFSLRLLASSGVLILAPILVIFFPYARDVKGAIIIVAVSFLFSSGYQILNGIFQKNLAMDRVAMAELIGKAIQVLVVYLAAKFELGFLWIVSALLINMLFNFVLIYWLSRKYISFRFRFDSEYWKSFLKESYPLGIAAFIGFFYFKMDTILLSLLKTGEEVGIYSAAYKVIENIIFFPAMIIGLIFPIMSQNIYSNYERFRDISDKTFKVFWIIVVPLVIGTLFLADDVIALIGGAGFFESGAVLRILIFSLAAIFFGQFSNMVLIAGNRQKKLMWIMLMAAIFNLIANIIFIPRYSYFACAIISVLTEIFVAASALYMIRRHLNYLPQAEKIGRIVFAGLAMAIYLFLLPDLNFFLRAVSAGLVYLFFLWLLRAVKSEEITSIISRKGVKEYEAIS